MEAKSKVTTAQVPSTDKQAKGRSTIEFPYLDLENSVEITSGIHDIGGSSCDWDQLAAHLKQAAQGGGFRLRMICAKQFGLITYDRGKANLTALGLKMVDPQQQRAAKVEAFLTIPLYRAIYDKFRGGTLPPVAGLEREMVSLGVAAKQADKARLAFARSAKYAGFFEFGADRLVIPANTNSSTTKQDQPDGALPDQPKKPGNTSGHGMHHHPFIEGLLKTLPPPETDWPMAGRVKWLQAAANIFGLIYTDTAGSDIEFIEITKKQL